MGPPMNCAWNLMDERINEGLKIGPRGEVKGHEIRRDCRRAKTEGKKSESSRYAS